MTTLHILHVDDDEWVRTIVQRVLTEQGFKVASFAGLDTAKAYATQQGNSIDLYLVDGTIDQPLDGIDWAENLWRQDGKEVIILSDTYVQGLALYHEKMLLGGGERLVGMVRDLFPWLPRLERALRELAA